MRELYIYYRVSACEASAALDAAIAMQRQLREHHPALQPRLLRRPDANANDGQQTWMEIYTMSGCDVDAAMEHEIEHAARAWAAHISGPRHCEVFCELGASCA